VRKVKAGHLGEHHLQASRLGPLSRTCCGSNYFCFYTTTLLTAAGSPGFFGVATPQKISGE